MVESVHLRKNIIDPPKVRNKFQVSSTSISFKNLTNRRSRRSRSRRSRSRSRSRRRRRRRIFISRKS